VNWRVFGCGADTISDESVPATFVAGVSALATGGAALGDGPQPANATKQARVMVMKRNLIEALRQRSLDFWHKLAKCP
jgi:hypothetical protein